MSYLNLPLLCRGRSYRDELVFPDEVFEDRDKAVRKMASDLGLTGVIVFAGAYQRGLICYLTYQRNSFSYANTMWIVPKEAKSVMLTSAGLRDIKDTKRHLPNFVELFPIGLNLLANDHIGVQAVKYLKDNGMHEGKWGIVNGDSIPYTAYQALVEGGLNLVDMSASFEDIKAIKDSNELYTISQAATMAQRAVYDFIRQASAGAKPIEIAAYLERGMRINGIEHPNFLISRGADTAFTVFDRTPLEEGEMISLYADIQFLHYHGAFGTTAVVGGGSAKQNALIDKAKALLDKTIDDIATSRKANIGYKKIDDSGSYVMINSIGTDLVDAPTWQGVVIDVKPCMALNVTANLCDSKVGSAVNSRTAVVSQNGVNVLNDFGPHPLSKQYA